MNAILKHKILAGAMLFGFMLAGTSCEDTEGIKVTAETPFADKTLYEVIKDDPDLSDFLAVIDACGAECADSLFNQSRVYTVWAPVNSALEVELASGRTMKDSIIDEIAAGNRDMVFRTFVEAHIANHLVPANGRLEEDNTVMLLNSKNAVFTGNHKSGYTFSGITLDPQNTNIRVRNGLLHKIASPSEYKYSIWEYLKVAENVDSVSNYLYSYNVTEFNVGQSLLGPIVNGEQTYLDSVFTTSNVWLNAWNGVGNIDSEDSTYVVYVPSNKMWNEIIEKTDAHFNYDLSFKNMTEATKIERDSLRRYYARLHNLKFMSYSVNEQKHIEAADSAVPAYRGVNDRPMFAIADLEKNVIFEKELSNGVFKIVDAMPYKPTDLYHDTIFLEGENQTMWHYGENVPEGVEALSAYKSQLNKKDSALLGAEISGSHYFSYLRESGAATAYFKIPKVLSAKYNVALIMVPKHITNEFIEEEDLYPNKLTVVIKQAPGIGSAKKLFEIKKADAIFTDPARIDTIYLKDKNGELAVVEPLYCEFYNGTASKDYNVTLEVASVAATNTEKKNGINYDTSIRIDKIMFIPVLDSEE